MKFFNKLAKVIFSKLTLAIILLVIQIVVLYIMFSFFEKYVVWLFGGFNVLAILIVLYLINSKTNPSYKIAWIIPILIFPVVGVATFLFCKLQLPTRFIGKRLKEERKKTERYLIQDTTITNEIKEKDKEIYNLSHYIHSTCGYPIYKANAIRYFENGESKLNELLSDLKNAKKYIFLEYFIIEKGYMWDSILNILKEKVKEGVEVRVMYDGMCSFMLLPYSYPQELEKFGIKCKMFFPIKLELSTHQNNRDHRKICVIDGNIAYTGGINIGDEYINKKEKYGYWKDTSIKLTGNAVNSFTIMFLEMWNVDVKTSEDYGKYIVDNNLKDNNGYIIPYGDNPLDEYETGKKVYMDILNNAKNYVDIITPYLILDDELLSSIIYASGRGVKVRIIMPHIPDKKMVYYLGRSYYKDLINNGVEIYEFTKGFTHAKMFISDNTKAVVGTINLDYRSLYLHFECACYIYKNKVIEDIQEDYDKTIKECIRIKKENVEKYNIIKRIIGRVLRFLAPLM